jgi:hypothetical protein
MRLSTLALMGLFVIGMLLIIGVKIPHSSEQKLNNEGQL